MGRDGSNRTINSNQNQMTLPKNKKIDHNEIKSIKLAVDDAGIQAIHPDKMEDFAEYLVQKARQSE